MRGRYRNSVKANEPAAHVFKVITSYFLFFFPTGAVRLSTTGVTLPLLRVEPAHINTHRGKQALIIGVKMWRVINLHVPSVGVLSLNFNGDGQGASGCSSFLHQHQLDQKYSEHKVRCLCLRHHLRHKHIEC